MSLDVDVFIPGEDGAMKEVLDVPEGCSDLAGFESWRTDVWGSEAMRSLGARFFPVLADADLKVAPGQVPDFRRECVLVRSNLDLLARRADPAGSHAEYVWQISERLANIEDAAMRAERIGAGVVIW